jgi:Fur family ferric uptake transcriptional regulator
MERMTPQRSAIESSVAEAGRPLLPREVLEIAQRAVPSLSIATVYRQLKALVEEGALRPVQLAGEPQRYETAAQGHHHHFQCTRCKRVFDVHGCPGSLAHLAPAGFVVEDHEVTLYGRCADCAQPPRRAAADRRRASA